MHLKMQEYQWINVDTLSIDIPAFSNAFFIFLYHVTASLEILLLSVSEFNFFSRIVFLNI